MKYDETAYDERISRLFSRFQSVQNVGFGPDSYKPGLDGMRRFGDMLGTPWGAYLTIHVAGTNGKGSVASMLASAIAWDGRKVGLYTSPHLLDFRERMKVVTNDGWTMPDKQWVWDFLEKYEKDFGNLSFFEITTGMAFKWFEEQGVQVAVIEAGLGGRLDSTNVITPMLSIITSIGLDHCAILGNTRAAIAKEKAGIFKSGAPALVWGHDAETDKVFGEAAWQAGSPLFYADDILPKGMPDGILSQMDLRGPCQAANLRTVYAAMSIMSKSSWWFSGDSMGEAILHAAARTGLRGRWERIVRDGTEFIFDIGHNPAALALNFARLEELRRGKDAAGGQGAERPLSIVYGIMADKDLDAIAPLMPAGAKYLLVAPDSPRSLPAAELLRRLQALRPDLDCAIVGDGSVALALKTLLHSDLSNSFCPENGVEGIGQLPENQQVGRQPSIVYVGGSTFVVSEALACFE
ncbi:MAG: bifunctional folylpolyglutamate synthase/dihydrofolate synthase [Bacteroidales bacterium]|nr:bifunctional folylpolyglutamate synthase/dihydrofolate synthase [Bacteroidales bacterium]